MARRWWALAPILMLLAGCGGLAIGSGPDRSARARQVEARYWKDIGSGQIDKAYDLLSSGEQQRMTRAAYRQAMFAFLQQTSGVRARVGTPIVVGDCALVPVALQPAKAPGAFKKFSQHMYWLNGTWRITEPNGGLYSGPIKLTTCATGT